MITQSTSSATWYGCLTATGRRWTLYSTTSGAGQSAVLAGAVLAGRFAALQFTSTYKDMDCADTADLYDLSTGNAIQLLSLDCESPRASSADSLSVDAGGFAAWRATQLAPCPTAATCLASQIYAHDDRGTRAVDSVPLESSNPLTNPLQHLSLSGDLLTWSHGASLDQITLR